MHRLVNALAVLGAVSAGLLAAADFFVQEPVLDEWGRRLADWVTILVAGAMLLGLQNILQAHGRKITARTKGWPFSVVLLASLAAVLVLGLRPGSPGPADPAVGWWFSNVLTPLNATVFSLLAFFVAAAAYRTLRLRFPESAVMMVAALVVLLGQVPIGFQIWPELPAVKEWLLQVPSAGALRGILLGVALGTLAAGVRVLTSQDRPYRGDS